jgi:hypothetical protein
MARRAIENALADQPDMTADANIQRRKQELIMQAKITLQAIRNIGTENASDPLTNAKTLTQAVQAGILDAPHLINNPFAKGQIQTRIIKGACEAINEDGKLIGEKKRLAHFL